jgi:hypothetical protein
VSDRVRCKKGIGKYNVKKDVKREGKEWIGDMKGEGEE